MQVSAVLPGDPAPPPQEAHEDRAQMYPCQKSVRVRQGDLLQVGRSIVSTNMSARFPQESLKACKEHIRESYYLLYDTISF